MAQAGLEGETAERRRLRAVSEAFVDALKRAELPPRSGDPGDNGRMILRHRATAASSAGAACVDFAY